MVTPLRAYLGLLAFVALQRGAELLVSARNVRRLRARGGIEAGRAHYRPMMAMHVMFLIACAAEALVFAAPPPAIVAALALGVVALAQVLRWWAIITLGSRWTTCVIALPSDPPVTRGPYRFIRHPNYVAVVLEIAALPLVYGSWRTALAFSAANAVVLAFRIGAEERALGGRWAAAFQDRPRFIPRRRPSTP